ncbi:unnamed protein product [Candida verbasci]|uniref:RRM domain-containing protein n=1 Tax=Candida verbasci TaxID=1227364 RepID=A0A9W4TXZ0_9ASCO|nr:unnamed protein product [Candida verbasci]
MSASLDKSLDDIIKSKPRTTKFGKKSKVGKNLTNKHKKPVGASFNRPKGPPPAAAAAALPAFDLSYATKVNVSGLPKDLKQENVKEFFQSQIGSVASVALSYNEKGQFKGFATVIFKNSKAASLAVDKYNNASIDGGSGKLKLELIIDTSKKPLASRIIANQPAKPSTPRKSGFVKKTLNKNKNFKNKKPVNKKKTVEELDQEMTDYFEK